ncbi:hypothetical protein ACQX08_10760, partial [Corynebacterium diphtheriae]
MMIKHQKEHHCSRWASTVAVSQQVGVSPNSIWNWYKKGALEAEEVHEFDVAYYKEQIERLEAKVKRLEKTIGDADGILEDSIMNRSYTNTQKRTALRVYKRTQS